MMSINNISLPALYLRKMMKDRGIRLRFYDNGLFMFCFRIITD